MSLSQLAVFPLDYALLFSALLLHVLYFLCPEVLSTQLEVAIYV